jgi:hypothetical protein
MAEEREPPELLAAMRLASQGVVYADARGEPTRLGQALVEQFAREPGKFIDRQAKLEAAFLGSQGKEAEKPAEGVPEMDAGSKRVLGVLEEWERWYAGGKAGPEP